MSLQVTLTEREREFDPVSSDDLSFDLVSHSRVASRVIKKKKKARLSHTCKHATVPRFRLIFLTHTHAQRERERVQ